MNLDKIKTKLSLNKKTVANLSNEEQKKVQAGIGITRKWSNCMELTCRIC